MVYSTGASMNAENLDVYKKVCKFIETTSRYIYIGYVQVICPLATVPLLLMSYFKYYNTELKEDAFDLPFLIWYFQYKPYPKPQNANPEFN